MNFSIQQLITAELGKPREKKEQNTWYVSSLGACPTGVYLARLGLEPDEPFDERTLRVFSLGKHLEDWIESLIAKEAEAGGFTIEREVRIELPELNISGRVDFIIKDKDGNVLPYELKSKHSKAFWYMIKKGEGPNRHHEYQLWCYLEALKVESGRLCYVSKDDLAIQEFIVNRDNEKLRNEVMDCVNILNKAWKEKLPPPPADEKSWQAKYCSYHELCVIQSKYLTI